MAIKLEEVSVGDPVVYAASKFSVKPGKRARDIRATTGDNYSYVVDKYWRVESLHDDGIVIYTRRGKRRKLEVTDPLLRAPTFWERLLLKRKFPPPIGSADWGGESVV